MLSKARCATSRIWSAALLTTAILLGATLLRERLLCERPLFVDGFVAPTMGKRRSRCSFPPSISLPKALSKSTHDGPLIESVSIEYCPGCRWMTKAFWMATELLQTCNSIQEVRVIPSGPGTFVVSAKLQHREAIQKLWDRKVDGGFPPIDLIEFEERVQMCLKNATVDGVYGHASGVIDKTTNRGSTQSLSTSTDSNIVIRYCSNSGYLLRAAYYGQELLTTFCDGELGAISLQPIESDFDGLFSVTLCNTEELPTLLWDKFDSGRFPEVKELKQLVRDAVTPQKDLGHSEAQTSVEKDSLDNLGDCIVCNAAKSDTEMRNLGDEEKKEDDEEDGGGHSYGDDGYLDDDEAEEARRYFGVM